MIAKWIDIDNGAWRVVVNYEVTPNDMPYILKQLLAVGASDEDIEKAYGKFYSPNDAFTISDDTQCMSLVCIGWTETRAQYHNSVVHEIDHVQRDIMDYYGIMPGSEEAAYLQGYLGQEMVL